MNFPKTSTQESLTLFESLTVEGNYKGEIQIEDPTLELNKNRDTLSGTIPVITVYTSPSSSATLNLDTSTGTWSGTGIGAGTISDLSSVNNCTIYLDTDNSGAGYLIARDGTGAICWVVSSTGIMTIYGQLTMNNNDIIGAKDITASNSLSVPTVYAGEISSSTDLVIQLDNDNDESASMIIKSGSGNSVIISAESGDFTINGNFKIGSGKYIQSTGSIYYQYDMDNNGTNSHRFRGGADTDLFTITDVGITSYGNVDIDTGGNLYMTNGQIVMSGTSRLDNDIYYSKTGPISFNLTSTGAFSVNKSTSAAAFAYSQSTDIFTVYGTPLDALRIPNGGIYVADRVECGNDLRAAGQVYFTGLSNGSGLNVNVDSSTGEIYYVSSLLAHKFDIEDYNIDSERLFRNLNLRKYKRYTQPDQEEVGLIAEELEQALEDSDINKNLMLSHDKDGNLAGYRQDMLTFMLIDRCKELQDQVDFLKSENTKLNVTIEKVSRNYLRILEMLENN